MAYKDPKYRGSSLVLLPRISSGWSPTLFHSLFSGKEFPPRDLLTSFFLAYDLCRLILLSLHCISPSSNNLGRMTRLHSFQCFPPRVMSRGSPTNSQLPTPYSSPLSQIEKNQKVHPVLRGCCKRSVATDQSSAFLFPGCELPPPISSRKADGPSQSS